MIRSDHVHPSGGWGVKIDPQKSNIVYICYNSVYGTYLGCITLYTAANESTVKNGFMALIISALPKKSWRLPCHNAAKQFTDNIPRLHLWNTFNCLSVYFGTFIIDFRTWGLNFLRGGGTVFWMGFYVDISWESRCSREKKCEVIYVIFW